MPLITALPLITRRLEALVAELPGVQLGEDPEAIHLARVACRRLRVACRLLGLRKGERATQRLGRALGRARDLDVQIQALEMWLDDHKRDGRGVAERRMGGAKGPWQAPGQTKASVVQDRKSDPWAGPARLLERLKAKRRSLQPAVAASAGRFHWKPSGTTTWIDPKWARALNRMGRKARRGLEPANPKAHHAFRLATKRFRYLLELQAEATGADLSDLLARLKALQGALGDLHDADVWIARLPHLIRQAAQRQGPGAALGLVAFLESRKARRLACLSRATQHWEGLKGSLESLV